MELMELLIEEPERTVEDGLLHVLEENKVSLSGEEFANLMSQLKPIDEFIRYYYREVVIKTMIEAGLPITLLGNGWDKYASHRNVTVLPWVNAEGSFSRMEQAKITLTVMPWFKAGTHERIFNALVRDSCPVSDESSYMMSHLKPDEECSYYNLKKIEELPGKLYFLLNHTQDREQIVANGKKKVWQCYTSGHIMERILDLLEQCYGNTSSQTVL